MILLNRFQEYLDTLKTDYTIATRVDFLYPDDTVVYSITEDAIQDGSTLNVEHQTGTRRTATLVLDNWANTYDLHPDKFWFGQKLRILQGVYLPDGSPYLLPQGVFYITNPTEVFAPSTRTMTFALTDKWAYLDGTMFGNIGGTYILAVGNNLFAAIAQLLLTDRGNGEPLDRTPPILAADYLDKWYTVGTETYRYLDCPYTAKISGTYGNVLEEINTMLVSRMGYDVMGQLRVESANADIDENRLPVLWHFAMDEKELLGLNTVTNMQGFFNHFVVTGGILNGRIAKGEALDTDVNSPTCMARIGKKSAPVEEQPKFYADTQCAELAKFRLRTSQRIGTEVTIESAPLFHLQENALVTVNRNGLRIPYLVNGWSQPLGQTGIMTISASKLTLPTENVYLAPQSVSYQLGTFYSGYRPF